MSLLGKMVEQAKANGSGEFIRDGIYTLMVERIFEQKGYEGECCIAEFRVMAAEPLDPKIKPNAVGSTCSVVYNATKNRDAALGNIKKLIMGLYGVAEDDVTDDVYDGVIDQEKNPSRGMLLGCRTKRIINKGKVTPANRGMEMTVPGWSTVEQTDEEIAKQRETLDNGDKARAASKPAAAAAEEKPAPAAEEKPAASATGTKRLQGILGKKS